MLTVFTSEQSEKWDAIARSFVDYDSYYLSGYVKAFQLHGDGEPLLFYYEGDNLRGINVIMRRDISKSPYFVGKLPDNTYFDFATPYGYGGWLIEGDGDRKALFEEYKSWCRKHTIVSEFVRFHPVLKNHETASSAYEVVPLGETVAMNLSSPTAIWDNLTSKNRNVIRKAMKNGVNIYNGRCAEFYRQFREIYNLTMDKDHAELYYYFAPEFYQSVLEDLPQNAQIFYAEWGGEVIASAIILCANGRMNYHLSGSLKDYQNLAPTNLLLYKAALWGCANGCKTLHLGGGVGSGEDSLLQFKKAFFRAELQRFHIGKKIWLPDVYEYLVGLRNLLSENEFFPKYRA